MSEKGKTRLTTILLIIALFQGPYFYYFTTGFVKLIFFGFFSFVGFLLTLILLLQVVIYHKTTIRYHILGFGISLLIGICTSVIPGMEYLDFYVGLHERNQIVEQVKNGTCEMGNIHYNGFLPLSNGGNDINYWKNKDGSVVVDFCIDPGFIDHGSEWRFTNNVNDVKHLDDESKSSAHSADTVVKKMVNNWYRLGY